MSKHSKLSIIIIVMLLLNLSAPFGSATSEAQTVTTDVTIHKIIGDRELEGTWDNLTGTKPEGHDGTPIPNIGFTYFKVSQENYNQLMADMSNYQTVDQVRSLVGTGGTATNLTNSNGEVTVTGLEEGYYYFVENGSSAVRSSSAVPFGLELPFTNQDGRGYIENLHVWPKNTLEDLPGIDKTVDDLESKSNSYNVGEEFVWNIQTTVPKGIDEYRVYQITDELDEALDFDGESVRVYYGNTDLVPNTDYNLTYEDHTITVNLTPAGLSKLGDLREGTTNLVTEITTTINDSAVMGLPIVNDAQLDFDNNHGNSTIPGEDGTEDPPSVEEPPIVYTGGKKFVKVNTTDETLAGAEFVVKNNEGLFLNRTTNGNVTWVESQDSATVLTSDEDGTFEVAGLKYGSINENNQGSTDYTLVETKAPEGYALPTNPETTFTVNASSYYSSPTELIEAAPMEIVNQQVTIPNTGGMGTILFTIIGLLLMISAFIILKRKRDTA